MSNGLTETPLPTMSAIQNKKRVGLIGLKLGMTTLWDEFGSQQPVTVIKFVDNIIIANRFHNERWRIQVGAVISHAKYVLLLFL